MKVDHKIEYEEVEIIKKPVKEKKMLIKFPKH